MNPLTSLMALFISLSAVAATESKTVIGFLEKDGVRESFHLSHEGWNSSLAQSPGEESLGPAFYKTRNWTIYFDGKTFGSLKTKPMVKYEWLYQRGLQTLDSKLPPLNFRKKDGAFIGEEGKLLRPIVVTTLSNPQDPDQWKRIRESQISESLLVKLRELSKKVVSYCKDENCEESVFIEKNLSRAHFLIKESFGNKDGNKVLGVKLRFKPEDKVYCETEGDNCEGQPAFWFLVEKSSKLYDLGLANALIDAGDFNDDGSSELLFWSSEQNRDGYVLYDLKNQKRTESLWTYH